MRHRASLFWPRLFCLQKNFILENDLKGYVLIYPILYKAFVFSFTFLCFELVEHFALGILRGQRFFGGLPQFGGAELIGILATGMIIRVMLIPFFAFREISRIIGADQLYALIFTGGSARNSSKFIRDDSKERGEAR